MSYVVGTSMAAFCHGQDHPGGVHVPPSGHSAGGARENSFGEREAFLGSRTALSARHRRVGGRNQHHLPARPHATLDQFPLRRPDRSVSGLPRHRGLGEEQRPEVLNGDGLMVVHEPPSPHAGCVCVLPGGFLVELRRVPGGPPVAVRLRAVQFSAPAACPPGHPPLRRGQLGGASFPVPAVRQVIGRISGRRGRGEGPVVRRSRLRIRRGRGVAGDDERCVPMSEGVPVDADAGRGGGSSRDHTTGIVVPLGRGSRPSRTVKPRTVYSSDGSAVLRRLTTGLRRPVTLNE